MSASNAGNNERGRRKHVSAPMEAVILAGGMGTRLKSVVSDVPKPMAQINGVPFLKILLDRLAENNVSKIILAIGYKSDCIEQFFGSSYRSIPICYSKEETPLGTGGAIKKALEQCSGSDVFVLNGDSFFDAPFDEMEKLHKKHNAAVTMATTLLEKPYRYGTIEAKQNRVTGFKEKQQTEYGRINCGVYLLKKNLLSDMPAVFAFEKFLEQSIGKLPLYHLPAESVFIDIGVPEDYEKAQTVLAQYTGGKAATVKKGLFLDRDGVINLDTGHPHKKEEIVFIEGIFDLVRLFNEAGWVIIVVTNQAGVAKGYYPEEEVIDLHNWMAQRFKENNAKIDSFYYCPHHPDGFGEYKKLCNYRKPGTGMMLQAQKDFSLDLSESVLIGDKDSDIQCAANAGMKSYKFTGDKINAGELFKKLTGADI